MKIPLVIGFIKHLQIVPTSKYSSDATSHDELSAQRALSKRSNKLGVSFPRLKSETFPVSETIFSSYLEFRTMNKAQKPSDSECYKPWLEDFRFNLKELLYKIQEELFSSLNLTRQHEGLGIANCYVPLIRHRKQGK
jgi:hypothetical protein